jgi:hypothetical protein
MFGRNDRETPNYGLVGYVVEEGRERLTAVDLDGASCWCVTGAPGYGKSYVQGSFIEMAIHGIPGLNEMSNPMAAVGVHFSNKESYRPEYLTLNLPNRNPKEVETLKAQYPGAEPKGAPEVIGLCPPSALNRRRIEFPDVRYEPMTFHSADLGVAQWMLLMGCYGDESVYVRQIIKILRGLYLADQPITVAAIRDGLERKDCTLSPAEKDQALTRLAFAAEYIDDHGPSMKSWLKDGRYLQMDLRDPFLLKNEALTLALVALQVFSQVRRPNGLPLPKLFVLDEAHKLMENAMLVKELEEVVREMRHLSAVVLIASQDPQSLPLPILKLASMHVVLRLNSSLDLQYLQQANVNLTSIQSADMSKLVPGEGFIWSAKASDKGYPVKAWKMRFRPRASQHGGATKTASMVDDPNSKAPSGA